MIADATLASLQAYIDGVMDGTIVTSRAVRAAVARHVSDLSRQSTAGFPYHFDAELAAKTIRFYPAKIRHSIGRYAGMPFELSPWQMFCTANIFGWLRDVDNMRRFRKAYRSMGRKNGKSTWIAAEAIYMAGYDVNPNIGNPEPVSQVVLSDITRDQVKKIVFAEVLRMCNGSPSVNRLARSVRDEVRFDRNDGEIITTSSDKPKNGLNPHCVVMDELHAWSEHYRRFYDTITTGSGARDQPLTSFITTAGDDCSHLWREVYNYASAVALGTVEDERFFSFIAELDEEDDPFDESVWPKANPNLDVSVTRDFLRQEATELKCTPIGVNKFTRYYGNRAVSSTAKAFDLAEWDACRGQLSDWSEADAVGCGVDLGARDDLAAVAFCARFQIGEDDGRAVYRYELRPYTFIAEDSKRDLTLEPFCSWIYKEYIKKTRYPMIALRELIIEKSSQYGCQLLAFDPNFAQVLMEELSQEGLQSFTMAQTYRMFNEPIRDLLKIIQEKRVTHDGNPVLRWCVNNAIVHSDNTTRWMYDKSKSSEKIDAIVAATMAFRVCCVIPARATGSLYL